jgi:hypothetical protein
VTDWTLITTTLGASAISASSAYLIAKRGAESTARQVEAETTRVREQIEGENERLRAQHREDHLRNRQGTYHRFVAGEYRYMETFRNLAAGLPVMSDPADWYYEFITLALGVELFGTENVRDAGSVLLAAWSKATIEMNLATSEGVAQAEAARAAYESNAEAINAARAALIREMRGDVAPLT